MMRKKESRVKGDMPGVSQMSFRKFALRLDGLRKVHEPQTWLSSPAVPCDSYRLCFGSRLLSCPPPSSGCQRVGLGGGHHPPVQQRQWHPAAALLPPAAQLHSDHARHHRDSVLHCRVALRHEGERDQHQQPVTGPRPAPSPRYCWASPTTHCSARFSVRFECSDAGRRALWTWGAVGSYTIPKIVFTYRAVEPGVDGAFCVHTWLHFVPQRAHPGLSPLPLPIAARHLSQNRALQIFTSNSAGKYSSALGIFKPFSSLFFIKWWYIFYF